MAFNAAFEAHQLAWTWSAPLYKDLLKVAGGKERLGHFIETLMLPMLGDSAHPVTGAARVRLAARWLELGHLESLLLDREQILQSGSHA